MRRPFLSGLLGVTALWLPAAYLPAEVDEGKALASKISDVTVYADRARVTRTATVQLAAEPARYAFQKLPGWIDEGSVRVGITPAGAGDVLDVQVLKTFLAQPDDEGIRKAQEAVQEISDQIAALDDERAALDAQAKQVEAIRAFSLEKFPKDAAAREVKVEEYDGVVKFLGKAMLETARAKRELEKKRRVLQPELDARQRKLNELQQPAALEQRTVRVTARGGTGGQAAALTLSHILPGATWEPMHELRTNRGAESVSIGSFAVVSQTTGEDWEGADISLSTQRCSETIRIPELEAFLLGGRRSGNFLSTIVDTYATAAENFSGQFDLWNSCFNGRPAQIEVSRNRELQEALETRMFKVFERLRRQRGTTAHFQAIGKQTIRTDGRPVRLPIGTAELRARPQIVAAPEISLNATQIAEMQNTGNQALLPGKVLLFVDGAFLGTTDVDFVAQGESFPVFLSVADQVKLSRTLDTKRSSLSWTGKRTRMLVSFLVTAENLSDRDVALRLGDRVPVSQTEEIRVQDVKITPAVKPDAKGLLKWEVTLAAKQSKEFQIEYVLDYPTGLPQQMEKEREDESGDLDDGMGEGMSIESPEPAPAKRLHEQILDIEKALK